MPRKKGCNEGNAFFAVSWSVGSNRCIGYDGGTYSHGAITTFTSGIPYSGGYTIGLRGSAKGTCNDGKWVVSDKICGTTTCPTKRMYWGGGCTGAITGGSAGTERTATADNSDREGSGTYVCSSGGSWQLQTGFTCTETECVQCESHSAYSWTGWGGQFYITCGSVSLPRACQGATSSGTDSSGTTRGRAWFECGYKKWELKSSDCWLYCLGGNKSWTVDGNVCRGNVSDTGAGASTTATDSDDSDGATGSAEYYCGADGAWYSARTPTCS